MPESHVHTWKTAFHLDACHEFSWGYTCACGAQRTMVGERDPADPYFSVWADEECERCMALLAGADRAEPTDVTTLPGDQRETTDA